VGGGKALAPLAPIDSKILYVTLTLSKRAPHPQTHGDLTPTGSVCISRMDNYHDYDPQPSSSLRPTPTYHLRPLPVSPAPSALSARSHHSSRKAPPRASWVSVHPPNLQRDTSTTASPVSTVKGGAPLPDLEEEEGAEYMTIDVDGPVLAPHHNVGLDPNPNPNLNPDLEGLGGTIPGALNEEEGDTTIDLEVGISPTPLIGVASTKKRGFVGGFMRGLKRVLVRGYSSTLGGSGPGSGPRSQSGLVRRPTRRGTGETTDTVGSLPRYMETVHEDPGVAGVGAGTAMVMPPTLLPPPMIIPSMVPPTMLEYISGMPTEPIPEVEEEEEDDNGPNSRRLSGHSAAGAQYARRPLSGHSAGVQYAQRPLSGGQYAQRPLSGHSAGGAQYAYYPQHPHHPLHPQRSHHPTMEIQTSALATLSPRTIFPSPTTDYDNMEYTLRPTSTMSFSTHLAHLAQFFRDLRDLPWMASTRVAKDYVPGEVRRAEKGHQRPERLVRPEGNGWYRPQSPLNLLAGSPMSDTLRKPPDARRNMQSQQHRHRRGGGASHAYASPRSSGSQTHSMATRSSSKSNSGSPSQHRRRRRSYPPGTPHPGMPHHTQQARFPGGYAPNFQYAHAQSPAPMPMYISTTPNSPYTAAQAIPVFLLAASPTGTFMGIHPHAQQAFNPDPTPAKMNVPLAPASAAGERGAM
jgi:hypothetical protein